MIREDIFRGKRQRIRTLGSPTQLLRPRPVRLALKVSGRHETNDVSASGNVLSLAMVDQRLRERQQLLRLVRERDKGDGETLVHVPFDLLRPR